jgi:hypothetical protein
VIVVVSMGISITSVIVAKIIICLRLSIRSVIPNLALCSATVASEGPVRGARSVTLSVRSAPFG